MRMACHTYTYMKVYLNRSGESELERLSGTEKGGGQRGEVRTVVHWTPGLD